MVPLQLLTLFSFVSIFHFSRANYDASGRTNVAMYWGQGPNQQRLLHYCQQPTVDIITLAFVYVFPAQGNGFPGTNFGNQCYGPPYVYAGPGKDPALNELQSECPLLTADIPVCQSTYGKKLILSLGGGTHTYNLTGSAHGEAFADFLWGAFGPQTKEWLKHGLPRPFDGPNNQSVEVDGFDFDIEIPSADKQAGYIAMVRRLREHIRGADKPYLITGAPQCVVPDANMGLMIMHAKFDIIWVQYYNTPQCSARNWVTANPNYTSTGIEEPSGFSFDAWETFLVGTESKDAKLYIGLPGSQTAAGSTYYLNPSEASSLIEAYYCKPNFGGISIWEATAAENNLVDCGETYYQSVKGILVGFSEDGALSCVTAPKSKAPTSTRSLCTISSTSTTSTLSSPSATSTFPGCTKSYTVVSGDYCYLIWTEFGITEAQLYAWNPALDSNCDLSIGQVLCVSTSQSSSSSQSITATSTTVSSTSTITTSSTSASPSACTKYYTVQSGDYCYLIWTEFGITEAQLYAYNPSLDSNCDLSVGQVLCVSESPVSTSSTSTTKTTTTSTSTSVTSSPSPTATCTKFYTVVSGDYCYLIYTEFGITEAQLYAYNPSLDANCDLSVGQVLCVSEAVVSSTVPSTSTVGSKSTTTSSTVSPTPTAACTKFYTVVSGDYCYLIYTEFGITEAQLYAYNPSLDTNCDLIVGQVLCVSVAPVSSSSSTVSSSSLSSTTSSTSSSSTSKSTTSSSISTSKSTSLSSSVRSTSSSSTSSLRLTSSSSVVLTSTLTSSSLSKSTSHTGATSSSSTSTPKYSTSLKSTTTSTSTSKSTTTSTSTSKSTTTSTTSTSKSTTTSTTSTSKSTNTSTSTSKSLSTSRTTSMSVSSESSSSSSTKTTSTTTVSTTLKTSTSISSSSGNNTSSSSKTSSSSTSSTTKTLPSSTTSSISKSTP